MFFSLRGKTARRSNTVSGSTPPTRSPGRSSTSPRRRSLNNLFSSSKRQADAAGYACMILIWLNVRD
jgi:hypothetical protein